MLINDAKVFLLVVYVITSFLDTYVTSKKFHEFALYDLENKYYLLQTSSPLSFITTP